MKPHYIMNHIEITGTKSDLAEIIATIDAKYFGYVEDSDEPTPVWETTDGYSDGFVISIPLVEGGIYDEIEALSVKYPTADFHLDWYEGCGSFRGWFYIEKGKPAGMDIIFTEYMCPDCCLDTEECECIHEPINYGNSSVLAPF